MTIKLLSVFHQALNSLDRNNCRGELIHHSDRGIQYCSAEYVNLLQDYNIKISMTENGDPLENPVAERVNGILKEEYLRHYQIKDLTQAKEYLKKAVALYNNQRPHMSIGLLTPDIVHQSNLKTEKLWKNRPVKATIVNSFQD